MSTVATIQIRVRPGASRPKVGGAYGDPPVLVVAVAARAVDGKATQAALRALADALGLPRGRLSLVTGATSRTKVVAVQDPPEDLEARVAALIGG